MEDEVIDAEAYVLPLSNREEDHEKEEDGRKVANKKEGHVFTRLIYGGEAEKDEEKKGKGIVKEGHQEEEEEEKGGGIIINFISNIVSPLSPKAGLATEQKHEAGEIKKEEDSKSVENGGGIINNLISNLFHQSNGGVGGEKREGAKEEGEENVNFIGGRKKAKIDKEEGEESGGIVDSIVSHLPKSLLDDAAPATDEASILISLVKD